MFQDSSVKRYLLSISFISALFTGIGFVYSPFSGVLVLILAISLWISAYLYVAKQTEEIKKLTHYLREISSGNYQLDVRDNVEGELSILKNEIYKVTNMLAEQHQHVEQDRIHLTNAISDISHQIKTPLTSMMIMADLMRSPKLERAKRIQFTDNIQGQLERLNWLVSTLLKLSKIDAGTIHFKNDPIDIRTLIKEVVETLAVPIDIKNIKVRLKDNHSFMFLGDPYWMKEALLNVIKNCVEHSEENGILEIDYENNPLYAEIVIKDDGKGIPKEDLPHIFTRFYKGKNASEESVGIGLAMTERIITSQGGNIEVSSEIGEGTQFVIKMYHYRKDQNLHATVEDMESKGSK